MVAVIASAGFAAGYLVASVLRRRRARAASTVQDHVQAMESDQLLKEEVRARAHDIGRPLLGEVVANALVRRNQAHRRIARDSRAHRGRRRRWI